MGKNYDFREEINDIWTAYMATCACQSCIIFTFETYLCNSDMFVYSQ